LRSLLDIDTLNVDSHYPITVSVSGCTFRNALFCALSVTGKKAAITLSGCVFNKNTGGATLITFSDLLLFQDDSNRCLWDAAQRITSPHPLILPYDTWVSRLYGIGGDMLHGHCIVFPLIKHIIAHYLFTSLWLACFHLRAYARGLQRVSG